MAACKTNKYGWTWTWREGGDDVATQIRTVQEDEYGDLRAECWLVEAHGGWIEEATVQ